MGAPSLDALTVESPTDEALHALCAREHGRCFACRPRDEGGLGLRFGVRADGTVCAAWTCSGGFESYAGILHGGVIATLLDSAMVHALFARGVCARTGALNIRFRAPARVGERLLITAELDQAQPPLYVMRAAVRQGETLCANAEAKFMDECRPEF